MSWAENYKEIASILPSIELNGALYLQYLMGTVKYHSTIESAFYGIKWAHNTTGLSDPCEADIVRRKVEASKRELCKRTFIPVCRISMRKFTLVLSIHK
jgi:hypothetical protein